MLTHCTNHGTGHVCTRGTPTEITITFVAHMSGLKSLSLGESQSLWPYDKGKEYNTADLFKGVLALPQKSLFVYPQKGEAQYLASLFREK